MWELISVMQLEKWMKMRKRMLLLDLRDKEDYEQKHIRYAVSAPYCDGKYWNIHGVPKNLDIVCICYRGASSIRAAKKLAALGYHAYAVYGGMEAWAQRQALLTAGCAQNVPKYDRKLRKTSVDK